MELITDQKILWHMELTVKLIIVEALGIIPKTLEKKNCWSEEELSLFRARHWRNLQEYLE